MVDRRLAMIRMLRQLMRNHASHRTHMKGLLTRYQGLDDSFLIYNIYLRAQVRRLESIPVYVLIYVVHHSRLHRQRSETGITIQIAEQKAQAAFSKSFSLKPDSSASCWELSGVARAGGPVRSSLSRVMNTDATASKAPAAMTMPNIRAIV